MRSIVIVKKLKTKEKVNADKIEMGRLAQTEAKKLVKEILGDDTYISYTGLLATSVKGLRITEGQLPPFKIAFKTKEKGVEFKEKAVQRAKITEDALHKTYFTCQQCLATRIRTNLMWAIVDQVKKDEAGTDAWVNQSLNKPTLQIKGDGRNQQTYTFVSAMAKYREKLSQKSKDEAAKIARKFFPGQVEKIFIVIKD